MAKRRFPTIRTAWTTPRRRAVAGAAILIVGGQGLQSAAAFVTGAVLARYGSAAELGTYVLGMSVVFLAGSLVETLISTPYTYYAQKAGRYRHAEMFTAGLAAVAVLSLVAAAALGLLRLLPVETPWADGEALAAALFVVLLREVVRRRHYAHGRPGLSFTMDVVTCVGQLAALGVLVMIGSMSAAGVYWAMAAAGAASTVVGLLPERRAVVLPPPRLGHHLRRQMRYGRWLAAGGLCHILTLQVQPWLLYLLLSPDRTGGYAACVAVMNVVNPLLVGLTNFARPHLMRLHAEGGAALLVPALRMQLILFAGPALGLFAGVVLFGEPLLALVYGSGFAAQADTLAALGVGFVATALAGPLQLALLALGLPHTNVQFHAAGLATAVAAGVPLVAALGEVGAAIAYSLGNVVALGVLAGLLLREIRRRRPAGAAAAGPGVEGRPL